MIDLTVTWKVLSLFSNLPVIVWDIVQTGSQLDVTFRGDGSAVGSIPDHADLSFAIPPPERVQADPERPSRLARGEAALILSWSLLPFRHGAYGMPRPWLGATEGVARSGSGAAGTSHRSRTTSTGGRRVARMVPTAAKRIAATVTAPTSDR